MQTVTSKENGGTVTVNFQVPTIAGVYLPQTKILDIRTSNYKKILVLNLNEQNNISK